MFVDIEFFGEDPLDNVCSCLKFKFDKVIFLGYADEAMDYVAKETVERFLRSKKVGVREVQFIAIPSAEYQQAQSILTDVICKELASKNQCYMDLSGGDEIVLAAAGKVATQYDIPMHEIDIVEDKVNILFGNEKYNRIPKQNIYLGIEEFLHLHEAFIDWNRTDRLDGNIFTNEHKADIMNMQRYIENVGPTWNKFSLGLAHLCAKQSVHISRSKGEAIHSANVAKIEFVAFLSGIEALYNHGLLKTFSYDERILEFDFCSRWEQELLCNPGAVLEHYVYFKVMEDPAVNECGLNYYLDWEGDGNPRHRCIGNNDVVNEIDVIYMRKNIPTFISCKNNLVSENKVLYELETVANRFGGTNVRKVLFAKGGAGPSIQSRAEEMGIELIIDL